MTTFAMIVLPNQITTMAPKAMMGTVCSATNIGKNARSMMRR